MIIKLIEGPHVDENVNFGTSGNRTEFPAPNFWFGGNIRLSVAADQNQEKNNIHRKENKH
jgi:hypothetical protein